jgi:uncharacterized membrane protein
MTDDALTLPPRRRRWPFILSLCLNVALIGFIAMVGWRVTHLDRAVGSAGGPLAPRHLMREYPASRDAINHVIGAHTAKVLALREDSRQARVAALHALTAPNYSAQNLQAALARIATADAALEAEALAMGGDSIATLSTADRQSLAARVKRRARFFQSVRD